MEIKIFDDLVSDAVGYRSRPELDPFLWQLVYVWEDGIVSDRPESVDDEGRLDHMSDADALK